MVYPNQPSPWYEFEMLKKDASGRGGSPTLFLHYKVVKSGGTRGLHSGVVSARRKLRLVVSGLGETLSRHIHTHCGCLSRTI